MKADTPVIYEIHINIFGKEEYLLWFLNWNATILNTRKKVDTALLISSKVQGVGKGLMFDRIYQPIYGENQCILEKGDRMAKNFNAQDQSIWLKVYDEVYSPGNLKENLSRKEWLKFIITARKQTIELKGIDAFQMQNHMNLILYSNNECPIFLDNEDRRFTVIRNENVKKTVDLSFYKGLTDMRERIDNELPLFANLLLSLDFNVEAANKALETMEKQTLKNQSIDPYEEFTEALRNKIPEYFLLDEVFPPANTDKVNAALDLPPNASMEALASILLGYIPARLMNKIVKFHFTGGIGYRKALARLKMKGLNLTTVREGTNILSAYKPK